jgi:hypothetical protein
MTRRDRGAMSTAETTAETTADEAGRELTLAGSRGTAGKVRLPLL